MDLSRASHTSRDFDVELRELHAHAIAMGARCERSLGLALEAFEGSSTELAASVLELDHQIDRDEMDIDALVLRILALRQPVASDLRFLTAASRLATDLERVGDEAVNIAERAAEHGDEPVDERARAALSAVAKTARQMLREALGAFAEEDPVRAEQVLVRDDDVDRAYAEVVDATVEIMANDPGRVREAVRVMHVAKYLERIADHATNIAEEVIFIVRGDDVRHRGAELP